MLGSEREQQRPARRGGKSRKEAARGQLGYSRPLRHVRSGSVALRGRQGQQQCSGGVRDAWHQPRGRTAHGGSGSAQRRQQAGRQHRSTAPQQGAAHAPPLPPPPQPPTLEALKMPQVKAKEARKPMVPMARKRHHTMSPM